MLQLRAERVTEATGGLAGHGRSDVQPTIHTGPTEVVEGYFDGDIEAAHDDFKRELETAGFTILFDEVEKNDSEVSWEGEGRSGQVAIRNEGGEDDKMYVKVTNRPAS